jgi:hypothetical protein
MLQDKYAPNAFSTYNNIHPTLDDACATLLHACHLHLSVYAARRWMGQALQQRLSSSDPASPAAADVICLSRQAAAAPPLPQRTLNDRLTQHTQHCTVCQQALQQLQAQAAAARAATIGLAAAAAALVGLLVIMVLGSGVAPGATAAPAAVGGVGLRVVAAAAMLLGAAAAAAAVLAGRLHETVREFVFVEFAHADND